MVQQQQQFRLVATVASEAMGIGKCSDVLTVLGGKASCRRKFVLNVQLIDEQGNAAPAAASELSIAASVAYAHDRSPVIRDVVERPTSIASSSSSSHHLAEPPLFTTFNGVEFPAHERPTRMIAGRASFKLAISLLSSKCDNRLFCICFTPLAPNASIVPCYSKPIRSISRKRSQAAPLTIPVPRGSGAATMSPTSSSDNEASAAASAGASATRPNSVTSMHSSAADQDQAAGSPLRVVSSCIFDRSSLSLRLSSPPDSGSPNSGTLTSSESCIDNNNNINVNSGSNKDSPNHLMISSFNISNENAEVVINNHGNSSSSSHMVRPFRPYASVGACNLTELSIRRSSPPYSSALLLERVQQLRAPQQQQQQQQQQKMNEVSLEEEEKSLQYIEVSLQEVNRELQRRKDELRSKRRRLLEDEARVHSIMFQPPSWVESLGGRFSL